MVLDGPRLATQVEVDEKEKKLKFKVIESKINAEMQSELCPTINKALMADSTVAAKISEII